MTMTGFSLGASFVLSLESADELQAVSRPATRARVRMRFTSILLRAIVCAGAGHPPRPPFPADSKPHSDGECKGLLTVHAADVTIKRFCPPPPRADGRTPRKARRM